MKRLAVVMVACWMLGNTSSLAAEPIGVVGWGEISCSVYGSRFRAGRSELFAWAQGFLSGLNARSQSAGRAMFDFKSVGQDQMLEHIGDYCARNFSKYLGDALDDFAVGRPLLVR